MVPVSSCLWQSGIHDRREDTVNFRMNPIEIGAATQRGPPQHRWQQQRGLAMPGVPL
jgi:hypothetical protein